MKLFPEPRVTVFIISLTNFEMEIAVNRYIRGMLRKPQI